jgi:hypothetical protein
LDEIDLYAILINFLVVQENYKAIQTDSLSLICYLEDFLSYCQSLAIEAEEERVNFD